MTDDVVMHREVLAPPDLEDVFGLLGGNIFHGEQGLDQMAFMRPAPSLSRYATPIEASTCAPRDRIPAAA